MEETLSPSGRVIRRVVRDSVVTTTVKEDMIYGYDGADSPPHTRPTAGGAVTTYVNGPGGLLLTDVGGTAT